MVKSKAWTKGARNFDLLLNTKVQFCAFDYEGVNFGEFRLGGLCGKHVVVTWNWQSSDVFLKTEENQEIFCRRSRSQDLTDTYWIPFTWITHKTPVLTSQRRNFVSNIKTNCLKLLKQMITIYGDNYTTHFSTFCEKSAKLRNITADGIRNYHWAFND
jgi:hypothetical protein